MPPHCECGGLIRPGIVWFGEQLPDEPWQAAVEAVATSRRAGGGRHLGHRLPGGGAARRGAGPRRGRRGGQSGAHAAVRQRDVTIRETASTALPGLLQQLPALLAEPTTVLDRPAQRELRHRQRHPGREVHSWRAVSMAKPALGDRTLGVAMGVAVARPAAARSWRRPTAASRPRQPGAGDVLEVAQLAARLEQRIQLPQNAFRICHRAQHQRAHHGVERLPGWASSRRSSPSP